MKNKKILVIANLLHASPRVPGISYMLQKKGWEITLVTPFIKNYEFKKLSLPEDFKKKIKIVYTENYPDIYEPIRKFLYFFKLVKPNLKTNLTEQIISKTSINNFIPNKFYAFLHAFFQSVFGYPDTEKHWFNIALPVLKKLCLKDEFSIIISSSPYPICHLLAKKILKEHDIKWVADFRDPWSQNHNYKMFFWRKVLDKFLEKKTIKKANLIITPSLGFKKKLKKIHKCNIEIIPNGYLPLKNIKKRDNKNKLKLVYIGRFYENMQNVRPLFEALKKFVNLYPKYKNNLSLDFYGPFSSYLELEIKKYNIVSITKQNGIIGREEIVSIYEEANVLILFNWLKKEEGIFPLKFYEYLNAKKLIFTIGKDNSGEINNILNETKTGFNLIDSKSILDKIILLNNKLIRNRSIQNKINHSKIKKYSIFAAGAKLDRVLSTLK